MSEVTRDDGNPSEETPAAVESGTTQSDAAKKDQNDVQESGAASEGNETQNNAAEEVAAEDSQPASQ